MTAVGGTISSERMLSISRQSRQLVRSFAIATRLPRTRPGFRTIPPFRSKLCSQPPATTSFSTSMVTGWATSVTPHSTASDPAETEAIRCLEQGTAKLEEGDVQGAKELYKRSANIKKNASSLFNLGVTHYHLSLCFYPVSIGFID